MTLACWRASLQAPRALIPFLQFTDDLLFLLGVDLEAFKSLRCILLIVEVVSSLNVNLNKSTMFPIGLVSNFEALFDIMGCEIQSLLPTYLGFPLGAKASSKTVWNLIIKRVERKLSG